jgi:hypothetical protein
MQELALTLTLALTLGPAAAAAASSDGLVQISEVSTRAQPGSAKGRTGSSCIWPIPPQPRLTSAGTSSTTTMAPRTRMRLPFPQVWS